MWGEESQFFYELGPDIILNSIDQLGLKTTGRVLALNSMENRVYDIECDDCSVVAKFYRPGRWSFDQIKEEHIFLADLIDQEIPVATPLIFKGETLFKVSDKNIFYSVSQKRGGRLKDELNDEELVKLGHTIARLHQVGKSKKTSHRLSLTPESFISENVAYLLKDKKIPKHLTSQYQTLTNELFSQAISSFNKVELQRIHGDCHFGNILWRDEEFFLVDFDDMVNGPCVQDLWPMVPADDPDSVLKRAILWDAYQEINPLAASELKLVPLLRAMRVINYAAWISKRYSDPAFTNAFPTFGTESYWKEQIQILQEILSAVNKKDNEEVFYSYEENEPWTPPIDWDED